MMIRDMVRRPLEQLLAVLWFFGVFNMAGRLISHHVSFGLALTAFLAGVLAVYLIVHYRLPSLFFVPLLFGLAALQIFLDNAGVSSAGLILAQAFYALAVWCLLSYAEKQHWGVRTIRLLNTKPSGECVPDQARAPAVVFLTSYGLIVISVVLQLVDSALITGEGGHSLWVLLTLLCAMVFFWFSGRITKPVLHSYLVLWVGVAAVMEGVSLILLPLSFATLGSESHSGSFFILLSLAMWASSFLISTRPPADVARADSYRNIYARSFGIAAIILALAAFWLQALQLIALASLVIRPVDVLVSVLAGFCLLGSNFRLRLQGIDLTALFFWVLALVAGDYIVLHSGHPFDLRPAGGYPDQWLLLGLTSLAASLLSHRLKMSNRVNTYAATLDTASAVCYGWALLAGTLSFALYPFDRGFYHLGMSLILIAGQFLLITDLPSAQRIRGLTVPIFLLAALFGLLAVAERLDLLRLGIVVFAFALLLTVGQLLPYLNRRWPKLAVFPEYPKWIGLGLVYMCLLQGGPDWIREWPWLLGAAFYQLLMRKAMLDLPSFLMLVLAGLGAETALLHSGAGFGLWKVAWVYPELCFSLALASFVYAVLSRRLLKYPMLGAVYSRPLLTAGALCWIGSLVWSLSLLMFSGLAGSGYFPGLFLTLLLALFPLSHTDETGGLVRDLGGSVLFSLAFLCFWQQTPLSMLPLWIGMLLLGFLLWTFASFLVPAFSRKLPAWAFTPRSWPWLGLLIVIIAFPIEPTPGKTGAAYFLALSAYSLLMLRYSAWGVFVWLSGGGFTAAGLALGSEATKILGVLAVNEKEAPLTMSGFPLAFGINTLAWANLQLLLFKSGCRKGALIARKLQLQRQDFGVSFGFGAHLVMIGWLLVYAVWLLAASSHRRYAAGFMLSPDTLPIGGLLAISLLHGLWLRFSELLLHGLISSLFLVLWGCYLSYLAGLIPPPMLLALWCLLLAISETLCSFYHGNNRLVVEKVLKGWIRFSLVVATLLLFIYPFESLGEMLLPLTLITLVTAFQGLWMLRSAWFYTACAEVLIVLHFWPFLRFNAEDAFALLPWFALQSSVVAGLLSMGFNKIKSLAIDNSDKGKRHALYRSGLSFGPVLNGLALMELTAHGLGVAMQFYDDLPVRWLSPIGDAAAALGAGLIQLGFGIRHVRHRPNSWQVYGMVVLLAALGCYIRLLAAGAAPVSLWDTTLLIVFAYGLFFMHRLFPSKPLLHMALLTPLAALFTVPFQLQSAEASATLFVTGALYLLIRRYTQKQLPVYLALLAFNIGLYLWIPAFVKQSHLVQIYVIPAALTILVLLQLHRRELKPSVIMATRLAATSTIYACATLDVFLLPDLKIFVLALSLSLAGILLGISLRIRAFLYAGLAFMLLNVFGQLVRFYPEQALGKAIILMAAGMVILGTMIWFNLKRNQIMKQVDMIRIQLASWE